MKALKKSLIIKILIWVPVILMAGTIFGFSKQDGDESQGLSNRVAQVIVNAADDVDIIEVDDSNNDYYVSILQVPIRKGAHMTEYAIFGLLILLALYVDDAFYRLRYIISYIGATAFAITDEIHQLYVPGRSGKVTDVIIDSIGCLIGLLICYLISRKRRKNR